MIPFASMAYKHLPRIGVKQMMEQITTPSFQKVIQTIYKNWPNLPGKDAVFPDEDLSMLRRNLRTQVIGSVRKVGISRDCRRPAHANKRCVQDRGIIQANN